HQFWQRIAAHPHPHRKAPPSAGLRATRLDPARHACVMTNLTVLSPAKLNLFLHITGRRADGYHELQTVFQLLDHGDDLHFESNDTGEIVLHCNEPALAGPDNLVLRRPVPCNARPAQPPVPSFTCTREFRPARGWGAAAPTPPLPWL